MKKIVLCILIVILLVVIFYVDFVLQGNMHGIRGLFTKDHNRGTVNVTINGEEAELSGLTLTFSDNGVFKPRVIGECVIGEDNSFTIKEGVYGRNYFFFDLPISANGESITVKFGHFNSNWWNNVEYEINLDITGRDILSGTIEQTVMYDGVAVYQDSKSFTTDNKRIVGIYADPKVADDADLNLDKNDRGRYVKP